MSDPDPKEMTVAEIEEYVETVDDVEYLGGFLETEKSGKDRKTAKEAIEARLDEVDEPVPETGHKAADAAFEHDGLVHVKVPDGKTHITTCDAKTKRKIEIGELEYHGPHR